MDHLLPNVSFGGENIRFRYAMVIIDISERERFILGFRLGAKVMLSVLTGESDTFKML